MIPLDNDCLSCYICKISAKVVDGAVYIGQHSRYQYFCYDCWLNIAGEEFMFERPANKESRQDYIDSMKEAQAYNKE